MRFWPVDRKMQLGLTALILFNLLIGLLDVWHWSTSKLQDRVIFFVYLVLIPLGIRDYWGRYWEFSPDALIRKVALRTWTIPYSDIIRVAPRNPGILTAYKQYWTIEYLRNGKTKRFLVNPLDEGSFLNALQERATNATFENWPPQPPNPSFPQLPSPVSLPERIGKLASRPVRMMK